ncbi:Histidine protein methyltransferase 1 [Galdieria sulphuraria]|uniref:protein-histidine N-methyltransferase n=1 Tax=Galdieria sulphuraria TaxID=130081 RepID=M2XXN4_GALSU|nr:uncharacterized protein Gasu_42060 [Galdieria sulphuraria]EME28368.1 hypothetical protein Gasu_42060 [Galdieria sulphuraria]GJD12550.1 Histidine protein methyltransferase 1 [Galdieria sulphuraria]|eukprot:XP_005704888.1 hypothetical protein Gasu_42060 [Galdieria sulphuraria]
MAFRFNFAEKTSSSSSFCNSTFEQQHNSTSLEYCTVPSNFPTGVSYETEKVIINNRRTLWKRKSVELTSKYFRVDQHCQDIISGVYEGGFKLWEGAIDLIEYLDSNDCLDVEQGLELGCGHGLPGIFALQEGVKMDFQDFNMPVITQVLFPNIIFNDCTLKAANSLFLAGDWSCLFHCQLKEKYDLILASEIVYRVELFPLLCNCLEYLLKDGGVAYFSGKCFYFGVGGGTEAFHSFIDSRKLSCVCVHRIQDGKSNVREILQVKKATVSKKYLHTEM